jgi:hypothetical protein
VFEGGMGYLQTLHNVVKVRGRNVRFAIVKRIGPRINDAVFGVKGGIVAS